MKIAITNLIVANNASIGTVVGVLTAQQGDTLIPCTFSLQNDPNHYFAIVGNNLITAQKGPMIPGRYSVNIQAQSIASPPNSAIFTIVVSAPPPTLAVVIFTPNAASLPNNAAAGTIVAAVGVSMSNDSAFAGTLAATPAGTVTISGNKLVLARALTPADNGSHSWGVTATQNGVTVAGSIAVQVTASPPPLPAAELTTDNGSALLTSDDSSAFLMVS